MQLVEFEDLNYDDEIFSIPEDQDEQTFGQESAKGNNSEVSEEEMMELESTPRVEAKPSYRSGSTLSSRSCSAANPETLLEADSNKDDETEEEAEAQLIVENNARWERCLEYQRKYCEEYSSNGSDNDEPEPLQDFRGNTMYEDDP
ncbi:hypothetical protein B0H16DRAFT_1484398 [Mycena metata]|uniref:Uncharacterized protein n=1 Tax=Mycena metata TaxID=1033252 RepID=A0AAD7DS76_9AGAR|nr:hypothetical protein B0H16DRAFT_1484398 [Mycena metata]